MTRLKSAREVVADFFAGTVTSFRSNLSGVGRAALLAAAVGAVAPIAAPSSADAASARGVRQLQSLRADAGVRPRAAPEAEVRFLDEALVDPETLPSVPRPQAPVEALAPEHNPNFQKSKRDLLALARQADVAGLPTEYLIALNLVAEEMAGGAEGARVRRFGPFQYSDAAWADGVARFGVAAGFGQYGTQDAKGRFTPSPGMVQRFWAGRDEASIAGAVAAAAAAVNVVDFSKKMGRFPGAGETMLAHFIGVDATVKLARASQAGSRVRASSLVPEAAKANPALFASGLLPLTAKEVIGVAEELMSDRMAAARDGLVRYSADARDTMDSHIPMRPTA